MSILQFPALSIAELPYELNLILENLEFDRKGKCVDSELTAAPVGRQAGSPEGIHKN